MNDSKFDDSPLKTNPVDRSNVVSKLFFCWFLPFFIRGNKRELTEDDMYRYRKTHDSEHLGDQLENIWYREKRKKSDPSFFKMFYKIFGTECLLLYIFAFGVEAVRIVQPLALSKLLQLYDQNIVEENRSEAYKYAGLLIFLNFFNVLSIHHFIFSIMQVGMKMRIACCSLIYRKTLKLSKNALAETTVGQIVNLMSNDVSRFDMTTLFLHYLVMGPLEVLVGMVLIYNSVGWIGLTGATFLLLSIPIQSYFGKKTTQFRLSTAKRTDERVRLMNEIISGIQVIKMYTWEKPFSLLVKTARINEMKYIKYSSIVKAVLNSCDIVLKRTADFLCIVVYVLTGNVLTASYVFTTISFYRILNSITSSFPFAVMQYAEFLVSVKRIKQFLMYDETDIDEIYIESCLKNYANEKKDCSEQPKGDLGISFRNVSVKWLKTATENTIENVTLNVKNEDLLAIVGPVGSGKSTLLQVILKELTPVKGTVHVNGTLSYASQEPWLFGASLRQNILFGQQYDENKYNEVVRVCALERDFSLFTHGDKTIVGERGITLSGGQRARVNLARAVYKEADIYLLDDPLSAVDTHVGKQLFDECICGYLKHKCVVLVTHQLQYLKKVNKIILLNEGKIQVSGSYDDLKKSETNFTKLLTDLEETDEENKHKEDGKVANEDNKDAQKVYKEEKGTGDVSWHVYKSYLLAGGHWSKVVFLAVVFVLLQAMDSMTEYFVTIWVNMIQMNQNVTDTAPLTEISEKPYTYSTTLFPMQNSKMEPLENDKTWWWNIFSTEFATLYYSILFLSTIVLSVVSSMTFFRWCIAASTRMHHKMFDNIVNSPMRFFNTNPSGRILNRFSRDIGVLDEFLPKTVMDTVMIGLATLAVTIVIGTLSTWIVIPTLIILALFYYLRIVFLKSSRDIKRIESITRSPVYSHLTTSMQGLATIRAFRAQGVLEKEFDDYQNMHSAAFFTFMSANRTFGFWLDFICVIYVALVIVFLLFVKSENFGGNIGLALTQAINLTGTFQWGMRQWSEMVNQMTSVERIQQYADLVPEKDDQAKDAPKTWPEHGNIEFKRVFLRYAIDDPVVLNNLNFSIKSKEKIGIVGRTGAGKSSLIQVLFRLTDFGGNILIDGVNSRDVSLKKLRSVISIIPQEPVLFSGSLRKNLDPFDEYDDESLWSALEQVELKSVVNDLPAGLENKMAEGGSNFSVGQRQLLCLARAVLRNNKILVLDEATANVDPHTDGLIQETIRKKFRHCTVLTIAHRLHTIMDSDKILVMDAGKAVEFDHPHILLQNKKGIFSSLVQQTGYNTAEGLKSVSEVSYYRNINVVT